MVQDTIFALSTILGKSGIAVIRIAGPDAKSVLSLFGVNKLIVPRKATYTILLSMDGKEILDEAIFIYFESPNSFTGGDVVELHLHGSLAVVNDVLKELSSIKFLRLAEPGEFTKIAFYNAKIDLTKAEALADLIDAETTIPKKLALRQLSGELESLYESWRQKIIIVLSQLEAFIDFPEDDIPAHSLTQAFEVVQDLIIQMKRHLDKSSKGEVLMRGINIAIGGPPNAGKSSLLNILAQKDIAIVSNIAGTTRDVIQVKIDLQGFAIILSDTAGIRNSEDIIELEGIRRAKVVLNQADINIIVLDASDCVGYTFFEDININKSTTICILNKYDLIMEEKPQHNIVNSLLNYGIDKKHIIHTSIKTGYNIDCILERLLDLIRDHYTPSFAEPIVTNLRQKQNLSECIMYLESFNLDKLLELAVQDIRFAANSLGALTGKINIEEILDEIFTNFCIGK